MNENFIFRSGKYAGKTIAWVKENQPSYLAWVQENQPNMLKGSEEQPKPIEKKEVKFRDGPIAVIQPNTDFLNEGPDPISLPYLKKMGENLED